MLIEGIPAALDALVMSLLSLEPAMRPRTAFEVMQRLAAIAGHRKRRARQAFRAPICRPRCWSGATS